MTHTCGAPEEHIRYEVISFEPDGDVVRSFATEEKAMGYARGEDVSRWNPIVEKVTKTVTREVISNGAGFRP